LKLLAKTENLLFENMICLNQQRKSVIYKI
jgi:hypothetical protein